MKVTKNETETAGGVIRYTHIENGSCTVCFMFSGHGYNYDRPLFYYSTMAMLENNVDIIHIHYSYSNDLLDMPLEKISETMMHDIYPVIDEVLASDHYNDVIFLGKSLGTIPIAIDLVKKPEFSAAKMVLLTPLLKLAPVYEALLNSSHSGLVVIGDQDSHYNAGQIEELNRTNMNIEVVANANHSLDIGEFRTAASISALSSVMEGIQEVINLEPYHG